MPESVSAKPSVAVIGLGSMGSGMATSLRRAGFDVTGKFTSVLGVRFGFRPTGGVEGAPQVSASTEQTSASTQEIAASAHELARTAADLDALVARFTLARS